MPQPICGASLDTPSPFTPRKVTLLFTLSGQHGGLERKQEDRNDGDQTLQQVVTEAMTLGAEALRASF